MPRAVTSFGAAVHEGWLYTLGGFFGTPHAYDRDGQERAFRRMNLADGSWQELDSPGSMQSVALVAHGEFLYRIGGMVVNNGPHEDQELWSTDKFERYDPLTGDWYDLPSLPRPRSSHMSVVIGDSLFVAGGWQLGGDDEMGTDPWHDTLLVYDLSADPADAEWREIEAPFRRRALGVATDGEKLYALGGMDADDGISERVDVYDPQAAVWSEGPEFPESGFGMAAVGIDGALIASGSSGTVFTLRDGGWHKLTAQVFPRFFHQWVALDDQRALVLGGVGRGPRVAHIEVLDTQSSSELSMKSWRIPYPGGARSGQSAFLHENKVRLFGGTDERGCAAEGFEFDLGSFTWETMSDLPIARANAVTAVSSDGERAFAIGGMKATDSGVQPAAFTSTYDVQLDLWIESGVPFPAERTGFALFTTGDETWLLGGEQSGTAQSSVWRAELGGEQLELESSDIELPSARSQFACAELEGRLYIIGGTGDDGDLLQRCDVLERDAGTWSEIPRPASHRIAPQLVSLGGRLFLAGGHVHDSKGNPVERNALEVFDPETSTWTTLVDDLPVPAASMKMFSFRDRLLLFSTDNADRLLEVHLLDVGHKNLEARKSSFHG